MLWAIFKKESPIAGTAIALPPGLAKPGDSGDSIFRVSNTILNVIELKKQSLEIIIMRLHPNPWKNHLQKHWGKARGMQGVEGSSYHNAL